ncbi:MAG: transglutaminase family protein [Oceanipulchritudo sp.]
MRFRISHETVYKYATPASESVGELRLCPQDTPDQRIRNRQLHLDPEVPVSTYTDFFGNTVECFSIPFRHKRLRVRMGADVETLPARDPGPAADIPAGEARLLNIHQRIDLYHYRLPTRTVPLGKVLAPIRKRFFPQDTPLRDSILQLNEWIHGHFKYKPGVTNVSTPLSTVIRNRAGVCQDLAHLMLSILRTNGLPARYVSGYIEPNDPTRGPETELIGAAASHAWVEVCLPDGSWWGLDPTNNQCAGERHVWMAAGRDYHDVAPLRGTYKGAVNQKLRVIVSVRRKGPSGRIS